MHPNGAHLARIKLLVEDEKIKPIIDKVYAYSDSIEAFTHLASGRAKGKIVINNKVTSTIAKDGENDENYL